MRQAPYEREREDSWVSHGVLDLMLGLSAPRHSVRPGVGGHQAVLPLLSAVGISLPISGALAHSALRLGKIPTFILSKSLRKPWG